MRGFFGLAGLLIALVIVGVLVKKQLAATQQAIPALQLPAVQGAAGPDAAPAATARQQSRQIEQQYKQAIEGAMQKARPVPDDN
ncbi:hypothetical protein [Rhodoferax sediminis]|jgi:hypothetical protein|uniref:Uncharacterized protein n=1 Tax=Rhodoferax sediminis TaxID=2509614 RepID=A0A515DB10_9BURK|nr:hypothetical protein [Rhodoferax sediminis]QDL37612.1 hypothetical protein EUB48_10285 [Rhodoferax sediminis]